MREAIRSMHRPIGCKAPSRTRNPYSQQENEMTNTTFGQIELSMTELATVGGGFKLPGWVKTAGEIAAPALLANPVTAPAGVALANKKALVHGGIWGAGGAIAGSAGGPEGTALGAAGGFLPGPYDSAHSPHRGGPGRPAGRGR